MSEAIINFEAIKKVLPHRYPFLLVDRILSVSADEIRAVKNVTANEPFFIGHFPELAVMPGVLQIEAMAQAAGLIVAMNGEFSHEGQLAFLAGIDKAKFRRLVTPGDQLILEAKITAKKSGVIKIASTARVDKELASQAEIVLVIKPMAKE